MAGRRAAAVLGSLVVVIALACSSGEDDGPADRGGAPDSGIASEPPGASADATAVTDAPSATDADVDAGPVVPFVFYDVNHVLGTGQSLSVGARGAPALSTTQPYANVMFSTGAIAGGTNLAAFVPLVEGIGDAAAPIDPGVETLSSAFANLVTELARGAGQKTHDILVSGHGVGGIAYVGLKKGTTAYTNGMAQVVAGLALARARQASYVVRAVTNVHGESDQVTGNLLYEDNLAEWQSNYEHDVRVLTNQSEAVPMLHTQMSSWTRFNVATSKIAMDQLAAHVDYPGKIILVGPKYHLDYVDDGVHLTNHGYQHMGEDYAKVYRRVILEGRVWEPLRPIAVSRTGAEILVTFAVPAPPLVLDRTLVTDPGASGFEFAQTGDATPAILDVALDGPDRVKITLEAVPTGTDQRLRYAYTGVVGALAGPVTGPRGNLRDSDSTPSRNGYPLYNWCVHFDVPVP
jgi:hypothetical protein